MKQPITSINPATGEQIATFAAHDEAEVEVRLARGIQAFQRWRALDLEARSGFLHRLSEKLGERKDELARLMTDEMGKPIAQARAEIEKCAWVCEHYAAHAARYLAPMQVEAKAPDNRVCFEPLGPVLAVMPWNFPFWQLYRFAAPALMAGNAVLLKHAANVTGCAAAMEDLAREAGLPEGLFQELRIDHDAVAEVLGDARVAAVTLTGSDRAGRAIAACAGRHLKKAVLELGGSDAFIVLADADVEAAIETGITARCQNTGQSCIAAKRFIIEAPAWDRFIEGFVAGFERLKMGDPRLEETEVGPLAREDLAEALDRQVQQSIQAGARALIGGRRPKGQGAFYPPTVLVDVPDGSPAADEEMFGPVAAVWRVPDTEAAIERANKSRFGLSSSLWTRDRDRAWLLAPRIEAGAVYVNQMSYSDPRLPFGGIKDSGYGRELGEFGIREFVNIKTVSIA